MNVLRKVATRVLPNLQYLPRSQIRRCEVCGSRTLFLCFGAADEFLVCVRCRANLRYEMLARELRKYDLPHLAVLELDDRSPLKRLLGGAAAYTPTFFSPEHPPGSIVDGRRCEDVTRLSFGDESLDLIVSSDVLEHVPDIQLAFAETARVLKPGGALLFTVPPREHTRSREGLPPEYHRDPLNPAGIFTHWDFGPDLAQVIDTAGLTVRIIAGPEGRDRRVVWEARK